MLGLSPCRKQRTSELDLGKEDQVGHGTVAGWLGHTWAWSFCNWPEKSSNGVWGLVVTSQPSSLGPCLPSTSGKLMREEGNRQSGELSINPSRLPGAQTKERSHGTQERVKPLFLLVDNDKYPRNSKGPRWDAVGRILKEGVQERAPVVHPFCRGQRSWHQDLWKCPDPAHGQSFLKTKDHGLLYQDAYLLALILCLGSCGPFTIEPLVVCMCPLH